MEIMTSDRSSYVRYHAYNAYMTLLQLALGVSDKLDLEMNRGASTMGWGATFEVVVPEQQLRALWQYLNSLYIRLSDASVASAPFDADGHRVAATDVYPSPSQGTLTSARFLLQQRMEATNDEVADNEALSNEQELLVAVLASRAVVESELEDIYAGPLGQLLLTQCERSRPRPLREIAVRLFRRLRDLARTTEEYAIQYFRMQAETVIGMYECSGIEAASALSAEFTRQWGPRMLPWLENPMFVVFREAVLLCVSPDRKHLPMLEVLSGWLKAEDFINEPHRERIAREVLQQCRAVNIDSEREEKVQKFLRRTLLATAVPAQVPGPDKASFAQVQAPSASPRAGGAPEFVGSSVPGTSTAKPASSLVPQAELVQTQTSITAFLQGSPAPARSPERMGASSSSVAAALVSVAPSSPVRQAVAPTLGSPAAHSYTTVGETPAQLATASSASIPSRRVTGKRSAAPMEAIRQDLQVAVSEGNPPESAQKRPKL